LQHEIDTGNILLQETIPIGENETAGELHDRIKEIGAQLLVKTIRGLADGSLKETPQSAISNEQWVMGNPSTDAHDQLAIENPQPPESDSRLPTPDSQL